ncbi:MAG: sensor histidine kinase [Pseudomonadota bacterium]
MTAAQRREAEEARALAPVLRAPRAGAETRALRRALHDLLSPLRSVKSLPDWVRDDLEEAGITVPPEVQNTLDTIVAQARRSERMTRDFFVYQLLAEHRLDITRVDLSECIGRAAETLGLDASALDLDGTACELRTDQALVDHILSVLLDNARKHHPNPPARIQCRIDAGDAAAAVTVMDDGRGIPTASVARMFEPFEMLQSRDIVEGSGLGLARLMRAADLLGATVETGTGLAGRGLSVRVTFPELGDGS